jgi:hypothetical protein
MNEIISCVYTITSPVGKVYIGSTCHFKRRMWEHSKSKGHRKLSNSIKKYGWDSHIPEIIHICCIEDLRHLEIKYKEEFVSICGWDKALFLKIDDASSYTRTESFKDKMRQIAITKWRELPDTMGMSGKKHNKSSNKKRVVTKINNGTIKHTELTKNKISNANKGKKHSDITRIKISLSKKGKTISEEHRKSLKIPKGSQVKIVCPHCLKEGGNAMKRWHFDNCKNK